MIRAAAALLALGLLGGCGYHRLDGQHRSAPWQAKGTTLRLAPFRNNTPRLGIEQTFRRALESRIAAASPWKLVPPAEAGRWVLQASIDRYEVRPLGLSLGHAGSRASAGTASRVEVLVGASVQLLDGETGVVVVDRPQLTFSRHYRVDQNFASFDNREMQVLETLADDFAESFLTQLLQGDDE